jgi:hypothetical protein
MSSFVWRGACEGEGGGAGRGGTEKGFGRQLEVLRELMIQFLALGVCAFE